MEMDNWVVDTRHGPIPVHGRPSQFNVKRPALLIIRGVFPDPNMLGLMPDRLPDADVVLTDMPGMNSPLLNENNIQTFGETFDEVADTIFPAREVNVFGVSAGGLIALAMRSPRLRRLLLIDTPLTTGRCWPLRPLWTRAAGDAHLLGWLQTILGIGPLGIEDRDYRSLFNGLTARTVVLIGGEALGGPRALDRMPSLVADADREAYLNHPLVYVRTIAGVGHNIPRDAMGPLMDVLRVTAAP